jgi:hypothetical protein
LFHEATHTSYDEDHAAAEGWLAAQDEDETFISEYAEDYPDREDVSESLLMWYAVRYRGPRINGDTRDAIEAAIPNRFEYFDGLTFSAFPQPLFGDYNGDSIVDGGDFLVWQQQLSSDYYLNNSGDESDDSAAVVDGADYDLWRSRFGQTPDTSAAAAASAAVPEPSTLLLLTLTTAAARLRRGRAA